MGFVAFLLNGLAYIVLADALLSWIVPHADQFPRNITGPIVAPIYRPIRALIAPERIGIDLSPLIAIVGLQLLARALAGGLG